MKSQTLNRYNFVENPYVHNFRLSLRYSFLFESFSLVIDRLCHCFGNLLIFFSGHVKTISSENEYYVVSVMFGFSVDTANFFKTA